MRDTEGVYEISLRTIRPLIVRNTLGTFYLWGCTPDPMPKADIKTKKFYGILGVILPEGNLPNPSVSGELQASRLPRLPWLKIPRQNLTSKPSHALFKRLRCASQHTRKRISGENDTLHSSPFSSGSKFFTHTPPKGCVCKKPEN